MNYKHLVICKKIPTPICSTRLHRPNIYQHPELFSVIRRTHRETPKVMYVDVMDAVSDSKDTITQLLQCLYEEYIIEKSQQMLVVAGDEKVYELILSLKLEYGEALKWVIPYPGD